MLASQQLSSTDYERRLSEEGQLDVNAIIISDESHIYLNGFINKQNLRKWSSLQQSPLHALKLRVWCGLSSNKGHGPYFLENAETGNVRIVTAEAYI